MRQAPRSPLSFKLQRVANVPEHPPPSTRLMSCAHIANRQLSRIIGVSLPSRTSAAEESAWKAFRPRIIIALPILLLTSFLLPPSAISTGTGVLRHQGLELAFGPFVVEKCTPGVSEERGELGPGIRGTHI